MQNDIAIMPGLFEIAISIVTDSPGSAVTFESDMVGALSAADEKAKIAVKIKHKTKVAIFFVIFIINLTKKSYYDFNIPLESIKVN